MIYLRLPRALTLIPALLLAVGSSSLASPLKLSARGKTDYVIALAEDAIPAERNASEQLKKYLEDVTGAKFEIKSEKSISSNTPQILVGAGKRVRETLSKQDWDALGTDGVVIKTSGRNLILAGGRPRGALYAVFQFLEDAVGCRWWTPSETDIPHKPDLEVASQDITYRPIFDYREHHTTDILNDPEFATIMRENGTGQKQTTEWGGHYKLIGWVHTIFNLMPPDEYFGVHPEWYSDAANQNKPSTASSAMPTSVTSQLCFSNPEVADEMAKRVLDAIKTNSDNYIRESKGYIALDENDNEHYCGCEKCRELAQSEGTESGALLQLVNHVAAKVKEEYPNFLVETLAYRGGIKPPKTIRPADNVIIRMAPLQADFSRPHNTDRNATAPEVTEPARDYLLGWAKISKQLFVWNYVTNFRYTMLPYPNWDGLSQDLRFFADNKVTGIYEQGDAYTNGVGDFVQMRTWLLSKLMWNPQLDQGKLMDEFLKGYYGAAAPFLRQYIDLVKAKFIESDLRLSSYQSDFYFMNLEAMNQATKLMNQAADVVKGDQVLSERVRRQRIPLDLLWVYRHQQYKQIEAVTKQPFLGPENWPQAAARVDEEARHFGVDLWQEQWDGTGKWPEEYARIEERASKRAKLPEAVQKLISGNEATDVINLQAADFTLLREKTQTNRVDDQFASNGRAIEVRGTSYDWNTHFSFAYYGKDFLKDDKWRLFVVARVKLKDGETLSGKAFEMGVYDPLLAKKTSTGNVFHEVIQVEQLSDGQYQVFDFGAAKIPASSQIWFAGPNNPAVESVYLDRMILVREKR